MITHRTGFWHRVSWLITMSTFPASLALRRAHQSASRFLSRVEVHHSRPSTSISAPSSSVTRHPSRHLSSSAPGVPVSLWGTLPHPSRCHARALPRWVRRCRPCPAYWP
ncbi:hypothetical protein PF001_g32471 [Phytophthora fragariae]|uniref:Secreted protein n=1 Tax=Phytophthora fragariae TaxID=53985 RepID=A0A6A4ATV3_9STRA|nr:hypothetical protein PF001_g32471 [Phytophthora fragariae]